jgi:hypothetical protein
MRSLNSLSLRLHLAVCGRRWAHDRTSAPHRLFRRHVELPRPTFRGFATEVPQASGTLHTGEFIDDSTMYRDADSAGLVGHGARDCLSDPPCGVGRKLKPWCSSNFDRTNGRPRFLPMRSRNCIPRSVWPASRAKRRGGGWLRADGSSPAARPSPPTSSRPSCDSEFGAGVISASLSSAGRTALPRSSYGQPDLRPR